MKSRGLTSAGVDSDSDVESQLNVKPWYLLIQERLSHAEHARHKAMQSQVATVKRWTEQVKTLVTQSEHTAEERAESELQQLRSMNAQIQWQAEFNELKQESKQIA